MLRIRETRVRFSQKPTQEVIFTRYPIEDGPGRPHHSMFRPLELDCYLRAFQSIHSNAAAGARLLVCCHHGIDERDIDDITNRAEKSQPWPKVNLITLTPFRDAVLHSRSTAL